MKTTNRIFTLIVAITMVAAMSATAFAENITGSVSEDPAANTEQSVTDTMQPAAEATNPTQPTTNSTQPITEPTQPTTNPTQPTTEPTQPTTEPTQPAVTPTRPKYSSVESKALAAALKDAGLKESQVRVYEIEAEGKTVELEFIQLSNRTKFEYEIATKNGFIYEKSVEYVYKAPKSKKKISKKKARKIVASASKFSYKKVKKGTCKYKCTKKVRKYEIKFRSGNYKYEYEILARTGKIIEYEYEYIGTR